MQKYHVVPKGNKWAVLRYGGKKIIGMFDRKEDAISCLKGRIYVHKWDGTVERVVEKYFSGGRAGGQHSEI